MLFVQSTERRTNIVKGKPPVTVVRNITFRNGKGVKTVEVIKGEKVVSKVQEPFTITECNNVKNHTFTKGLFKSADTKTLSKMNSTKSKSRTKKQMKKQTKKQKKQRK